MAEEKGVPGLKSFDGIIQEAYSTELRWPGVYPIFERMRRADPEIAIIRNWFINMSRATELYFELDDKASDGEKQFAEFGDSVLDDMLGSQTTTLEMIVSTVPFYGWGSWNLLPGKRVQGWRNSSDWESDFDDGLIGVRELSYRSPGSFSKWLTDPKTGKIYGWRQSAPIDGKMYDLPFSDLTHLQFGDPFNPEGLSPLETVWRLERIKYALELVQGIGFEHAAGYLDVIATRDLVSGDEAAIRKAARAVTTAQEGNYAAWPKGITGELKDVPFSAAATILEAIRYYGLLKMMAYFGQWMGIATIASTGSYSASNDLSGMAVDAFNGMMEGFAVQLDDTMGRRLLKWNAASFTGIVNRPKIRCRPVPAKIDLGVLGQFITAIQALDLGPDDIIAIRRHSGILPDTLPQEVINERRAAADAAPAPAQPDERPHGDETNQPGEPETGIERELAGLRSEMEKLNKVLE